MLCLARRVSLKSSAVLPMAEARSFRLGRVYHQQNLHTAAQPCRPEFAAPALTDVPTLDRPWRTGECI